MFTGKNDSVYGALLIIKATRVSILVTKFDAASNIPHLIWTHTESIRFDPSYSGPEMLKRMESAILRASLELDNRGVVVNAARLRCVIGAPWSHTVSRNIITSNEQPERVTKRQLEDLAQIAEEQSLDFVSGQQFFNQLGITPILKRNTGIKLNGYDVQEPIGLLAESITIEHAISIAETSLIAAVTEMHDKILPKSELTFTTFNNDLQTCISQVLPQYNSYATIELDTEVSTMSVFEGNTCRVSLYQEFGYMDLVRALTEISGLPKTEILGLLRTDIYALRETLSKSKKNKFTEILSDFSKSLNKLSLSIARETALPRDVILVSNLGAPAFLINILCSDLGKVTGLEHFIQPLTSKFFKCEGAHVPISDLAVAYTFNHER
tara:strand:+ start:196 stop:1338 length:1143 start_codon:yes stop_codon:yes gene_type:complete